MSTRSLICIENNDLSVESVYCHWDGYVEYNGKILFNNYTTEAKVRELIAGGNMSTLNASIDKCEFYGNEPAETDVSLKALIDSVKEEGYIEYVYIFTKGNWMAVDVYGDRIVDLALELNKTAEVY